MRVRDVLTGLGSAPVLSLNGLAGAGGIVILAPHPDDEVLGCGGLISAARQEERPVELVFLTDGAASHPGSIRFPPTRLAQLRVGEAQAAATVLGVPHDRVTFLGLPDAAAPCHGPTFEDAVEAVVAAAMRADATALFVTWEHDPHCDHEAAAAVAVAAAGRRPEMRLWRYPIWGLYRPPDDALDQRPWRGARFDVSHWRDRKRQALACHASQLGHVIDDDPDGFRLSPETVEPFLEPFERFIGDAV